MSPKRPMPDLPDEVLALADDIREEILDIKHITHEHGRRGCYTLGCRGPLCLRAERIFNRKHYAAKRARLDKDYSPSELRRDERNQELDDALITWLRHRKIIEIVAKLTDFYREQEAAS